MIYQYDSFDVMENEDDEQSKGKSAKGNPMFMRELMEKQRTLFISEEVSPKLTKRIVPSLLWLDSKSDDPIRLFIDTP